MDKQQQEQTKSQEQIEGEKGAAKYTKWRNNVIDMSTDMELTPHDGFMFMFMLMREMEQQSGCTPEQSVFKDLTKKGDA